MDFSYYYGVKLPFLMGVILFRTYIKQVPTAAPPLALPPAPWGQAQDLTLQRGGEMNSPGVLSAFWLAFSNFV